MFLFGDKYKSYSQSGEDRVVDFVLRSLGIINPSYFDIGAHHPVKFNNTYLFYKQGGSGVCVEPNPFIFSELKRRRKRDICLNIGVSDVEKTHADFYRMNVDTLSTFSLVEAERLVKECRVRIEEVINIDLATCNAILEKYFETYPNFISIDIEGDELKILRSFDFTKYRPEIFCVETLCYSTDGSGKKADDTISFMCSKGYIAYADTYINTIFVDAERWESR